MFSTYSFKSFIWLMILNFSDSAALTAYAQSINICNSPRYRRVLSLFLSRS